MCVSVWVGVCVFESLPVKAGGRELVHCTLSQLTKYYYNYIYQTCLYAIVAMPEVNFYDLSLGNLGCC